MYSVGNFFKCVVVIVVFVIIFCNLVSMMNIIGIVLVIFGVIFYG